jgi:heme-degrading monooxygenase HmoA
LISSGCSGTDSILTTLIDEYNEVGQADSAHQRLQMLARIALAFRHPGRVNPVLDEFRFRRRSVGSPFDLVRVMKARAAVDEGTTKLIPNNGQLTLINTYTVQPDRAEELIEFLARATQETLRYVPGFISANLHRSFDRTKVVNYAQWVDAEATGAARQDSRVAELMRQQLQIAETFNPHAFTLRSSISAASGK